MNWIKNAFGLKPTQDEFAEIVKKTLVQSGLGSDFTYDRDQFALSIRQADGSVSQSYFLHNAYADYCAAPGGKRHEVLSGYFFKPVETPALLSEAQPNILPRIQARAYYEEIPLVARLSQVTTPSSEDQDALRFPYIVIAEHLAHGIVFDSPQSLSQVSMQTCKGWNTTGDELRNIGLSNLQKLTPKPFVAIAPGIYSPNYGDSHDATRILLRERLAECRVEGRVVALVANRDTLLITGEDDTKAHGTMIRIAEEAMKHPRAMPMIPLVLENGVWSEMPVPASHPYLQKFAYLKALSLSDLYGNQKALLEQMHKIEGNEDIFVATFMATQHQQSGAIFTRATWTADVPTYLPKVEQISFVVVDGTDGKVEATVAWQFVEEIVGSKMKKLDIYPQRYFVEDFPDQAQMAELKSHNIS